MTPFLAFHDTLWWPADDIVARPIVTGDRDSDIARFLSHVPGREVIVQAGSNVGTYAIALAREFGAVVTAEPDPTNYECLKRNLALHDTEGRVTALHAAFGETEGECTPREVHAHNCAAHRVEFDKGPVPVWTVDGLELTACDAIWADCEGSELFLLRGAVETIKRFSPVISVEDKGLDHAFFGLPRGSVPRFLGELGYVEIDRYGRDKVFRRAT